MVLGERGVRLKQMNYSWIRHWSVRFFDWKSSWIVLPLRRPLISWSLTAFCRQSLTLSACVRVTVVVLCVCVWVCLLLNYLLHTSFTSLKCAITCFLVVFKRYASSQFRWKCFALQFCRHSLSTTPFYTPWWVLNGHDEYQWYWLFLKWVVSVTAYVKLLLTKSSVN